MTVHEQVMKSLRGMATCGVGLEITPYLVNRLVA